MGKLVFDRDGGDAPGGVRATQYERIRHLQHLVTERGASLVLVGDWPVLPNNGRFALCAGSAAWASQCALSRADALAHLAVERSFSLGWWTRATRRITCRSTATCATRARVSAACTCRARRRLRM